MNAEQVAHDIAVLATLSAEDEAMLDAFERLDAEELRAGGNESTGMEERASVEDSAEDIERASNERELHEW